MDHTEVFDNSQTKRDSSLNHSLNHSLTQFYSFLSILVFSQFSLVAIVTKMLVVSDNTVDTHFRVVKSFNLSASIHHHHPLTTRCVKVELKDTIVMLTPLENWQVVFSIHQFIFLISYNEIKLLLQYHKTKLLFVRNFSGKNKNQNTKEHSGTPLFQGFWRPKEEKEPLHYLQDP